MYIYNGKVYTCEGTVITSGFVQIEDSKIVRVGNLAEIHDFRPCDNDFDAEEGVIMPGIIDAHSHIGMWEDGLGFEGADANEETDAMTPQLRAIDSVNHNDRCFSEILAAGVTACATGPGSANPIAGQVALLKTYGTCVDDMVILAPCAMKFALGENPKTVYHGKNQMPTTRMSTSSIIREGLMKAKRYSEMQDKANNNPDIDEPDFDFKCEALLPVVKGELPVHIHCHRADDIYTALRLKSEFNLKMVLVHATEGHLIKEAILKSGVGVFSGPFLTDRSKPELKNLTPKSPGIMQNFGIICALISDHPVIPAQYMTLLAALAVKEGMDYMSALEAITIVPARLLGADKQIGSLAPGKDGDVVVFDKEPFDMFSKVKAVFVNGIKVTQ